MRRKKRSLFERVILFVVFSKTTRNRIWRWIENRKYYLHRPEGGDYPIHQAIVAFPKLLKSAKDRISILNPLPDDTLQGISNSTFDFQIIPTTHIFRSQSPVVPLTKEYQLLHQSTTFPPLDQGVTYDLLGYYHQLFLEYQSELYQKHEIRQNFIASPGYVLLTADYSQIELRLLTHFCKDEFLLKAFNQPPIDPSINENLQKKKEDIFERLAAIYKNKSIEFITKQDRQEIKQLSYAVIYGAGPKLISEQMNIPINDAKKLIADFHSRFPRISLFIKELYEECHQKGYVETLFGRRRYLGFDKLSDYQQQKKKNKKQTLQRTNSESSTTSSLGERGFSRTSSFNLLNGKGRQQQQHPLNFTNFSGVTSQNSIVLGDGNSVAEEDDEEEEEMDTSGGGGGDQASGKDWKLISKLQRQVVNTLCQGSAADLIKVSTNLTIY